MIPPGRIIPPNQLWAGNPVEYIKDLDPREKYSCKMNVVSKLGACDAHAYDFTIPNSAYL